MYMHTVLKEIYILKACIGEMFRTKITPKKFAFLNRGSQGIFPNDYVHRRNCIKKLSMLGKVANVNG